MLISRGAKENQALFKGKRFVPRVVTRKKCPLPNDVVKVYSFLAYKARDGGPVRPALIARRTGLERGRSGERTGKARSVPRHLEALIAEGLARKAEVATRRSNQPAIGGSGSPGSRARTGTGTGGSPPTGSTRSHRGSGARRRARRSG